MDIVELTEAFCAENGLSVTLSGNMPAGYETAFGTYDVTVNTLFLNSAMLQGAPEYEVLYYLYHELRHAMQYVHPERFDPQIRESRFYVVLYNGICYKLMDSEWHDCVLEGEENLMDAYLSLPYEVDANGFAYETVRSMLGDSSELQKLYGSWMPKRKWQYDELRELFERIDFMLG